MNTQALAYKLKLLGHGIVGYNSFGIVEQVGLGYILHIENKGKMVTLGKEQPYICYNVLEHFIIMRGSRVRQSLFVKGKGYDVLRTNNFTRIWGEPDKGALIPGATWTPTTGADKVITTDKVLGFTDGRGFRRLVNYEGKIIILDNKNRSESRIIKHNNEYTVVRFTPREGHGTLTIEDITVDSELNIIKQNLV